MCKKGEDLNTLAHCISESERPLVAQPSKITKIEFKKRIHGD